MILVLTLMTPFFSALLLLFLKNHLKLQRILSLIGLSATMIFSGVLFGDYNTQGIQVIQAGEWAAPFGITLVADGLASLMVAISAFLAWVVGIYGLSRAFRSWQNKYFAPLYHFLLAGILGTFLTGDFFNLYVFFEIFLMSSFALLTFERTDKLLGGLFKYTLLNLLASALFLVALALMYNTLGTLNMAQVAELLGGSQNLSATSKFKLIMMVVFFLMAFGMKAGVFPLWSWLPSSYPVTPYPIAALFAGLLTKIGVYALLRMKSFEMFEVWSFFPQIIVVASVLTQIVGVLGAATQSHFSRILSFHILSQIGYMVLVVGLPGESAYAACVLYLIHHIVVKANLFLVGGAIESWMGSSQLKNLGGVLKNSTLLPIFFAIPAFSLVGIPPLSGFWAKFAVLREAWLSGGLWVLVAGLVTSFLTLYSMTKIWNEVFLKALSTEHKVKSYRDRPQMIAMSILCVWTLLFAVFAEQIVLFSHKLGNELNQVKQNYVRSVLYESQPAQGRGDF